MGNCIVCGIENDACQTCYSVLKMKHKENFKECLERHREHNKSVVDLFAGCGGFSHGFLKAGYDVIGFVEWWQPAINTFMKNHPNAELLGKDITTIKDEDIAHLEGQVDVLIGGPPCQGFSLCGKRDPKDKRNQLYKEFLRFVRVINPNIVVMENVPHLLSMKDSDGEPFISKIFRDFNDLNYSVSYKVLTASDHGVAQNRKRLIIVAQKIKFFPYKLQHKKSVMEAISDVPEELQEYFKTTPEVTEKIKTLKEGEKLSPSFNFSRQRLFANKPSRTVTTKPMYIHPYEHRFLTPRELARLQSFPDDFEFTGTKSDQVKQIGNAVPPLLAQRIAEELREVNIA